MGSTSWPQPNRNTTHPTKTEDLAWTDHSQDPEINCVTNQLIIWWIRKQSINGSHCFFWWFNVFPNTGFSCLHKEATNIILINPYFLHHPVIPSPQYETDLPNETLTECGSTHFGPPLKGTIVVIGKIPLFPQPPSCWRRHLNLHPAWTGPVERAEQRGWKMLSCEYVRIGWRENDWTWFNNA